MSDKNRTFWVCWTCYAVGLIVGVLVEHLNGLALVLPCVLGFAALRILPRLLAGHVQPEQKASQR